MLPFNQGIIIPCFNEQEYKRLDTVKDIYFEKTDTTDKNFVNTSKTCSRSALFRIKSRASLKYLVKDYSMTLEFLAPFLRLLSLMLNAISDLPMY